MKIKQTNHILFIFLVLLVVGCATGITQQSRSRVTFTGSFSELQKTPDAYVDEVVILGGKILEIQSSQTSSEVAVLQLPLGSKNRPVDSDQSKGRFLVQTDQFLDPAIFQKGRLLTAVVTLKSSQARAIGGFKYVYPILEAIEIKLWPAENRTKPSFRFGIGIGTTF
jgi:outer membrane lipoprotein